MLCLNKKRSIRIQERRDQIIVSKQTGMKIIQASNCTTLGRGGVRWSVDNAGSIFARDIEGLCDTLSEMKSLLEAQQPDQAVFSIRTLDRNTTHDMPIVTSSDIQDNLPRLILCEFLLLVCAGSLHQLSLSWEGRDTDADTLHSL